MNTHKTSWLTFRFFSSFQLDTSASEPTAAIQSAPGKNTTAADLGLKDFYTIHVLTYCEGNFQDDNHHHHAMQVTNCSHRRAPFAFNPASVELKAGFNISDINWPDDITDDFDVMAMTTKAMSVLYIIGMAATGVSFLMEILLTQAGGKPSMFAHLFFTVVCFVALVTFSFFVCLLAL